MRIVFVIAAVLLAAKSFSQTESRLIPKKGWFVTTQGLTWSEGSEVNFFTPDKKHHHYYFTWWEQDTDSSVSGRDILQIGSTNTAVDGRYALEQHEGKMVTAINCRWNRAEKGLADIVYLKLWLPFFRDAEWLVQGRAWSLHQMSSFQDTMLEVKTPFGHFRLHSSHAFRIRRNDHPQPGGLDYDKRSQYLLLYEENISVDKEHPLKRHFSIEPVHTTTIPVAAAAVIENAAVELNAAWDPSLPAMQVLPRPQFMQLQQAHYRFPLEKPSIVTTATARFREMLQLHWQIGDHFYPSLQSQTDANLHEEGYRITIGDKGITLFHRSAAGLQHALHTLLQLVQHREGSLVVPVGEISDAPAISWRGIHMFTGPTSLALHRRMYDRVLLPLKMNKVVLQCEQAEWKSFPNIHNRISVPLQDLKEEFQYLRRNHAEPIPLIQSLGHMEWFFKPNANRFMAVNPLYPYTLNPELKASRKAVKQIWDEAFRLLQPKVMHIGFDEIGMIGFHQPREKEIDHWKTQLQFLDRYAQKKKARLMLWGDMGLGPGEGPDALNGITKERASLLRSTIPPGSYVADWHYISNPDPDIYKVNLRIWKENKNLPLASPWLRPNNVRGFVLAAKDEGAGVLQTTWADFESSEKNMLLNIEQFGAYVLALDYAWSGRQELPKELPYDAVEEWCTRFYSEARPTDQRKGLQLKTDINMRNITSSALQQEPEALIFPLAVAKASGFRIKALTEHIIQEGTPVSVIQFYNGGTLVEEYMLRYGTELRSKDDQRSIFAHVPGKDRKTFYRFFGRQHKITEVKIQLLHKGSGLKLEELVVIE